MRRIRAFAACLLVAATAAACTSSTPTAPPTPTPTSSAPTTPTPVSSSVSTTPAPAIPTVPADVPTTGPNIKPGERPPVMPVAATQHTPAGAAAFAKFFMRTVDWGYAVISGTYLVHLSSPACDTCLSLAKDLNDDRKARHQYVGGRLTIIRSIAGAGGPTRAQTVVVDSTSFEELTSTGKFVSGDPAYHNQEFSLDLRWSASKWSVVRLRLVV